MTAMVTRVISGGQTGADQGALAAATVLDIETSGHAPKGWLTEAGPQQVLLQGLGLTECPFGRTPSEAYRMRAAENVRDSDGTLLIGDMSSPGCRLTRAACEAHRKPHLVVAVPNAARWKTDATIISTVRQWLEDNKIAVLNVAGNRESRNSGIHRATRQLLLCVLHASRRN